MRAARRIRRQVMVGCALVIAVCLILTILIVTIARGRRPGSGAVVPGVALAARAEPAPATGTAATPLTVRPSIVNLDAAASEGEHR
jgi:integral membrane sensor domain MASE1